MREFLLGVLTSLLATAIWVVATYIRRTFAIRNLRGVWIEFRHAASKNLDNVCFLELRYSFTEKSYRIEGLVYDKDWHRVARWATMSCVVDHALARIFYSYSGSLVNSPFMTMHGYGLISLRGSGKRILMEDGYYLDATLAGTAPASCDYIHITSVSSLADHLTSIGDIDFAMENPQSPVRRRIAELIAERRNPGVPLPPEGGR
jgi:hypothetical protein